MRVSRMTEVNTGGWIDVYEPNNATEYYPDRVYYAVERVGASLAHDRLLPGKHSAQGNTRDTEYERPAAAWSARCRAAPLAAAKALVACFRSFVEGGFLMEDLDGHQFTFVEATGNVYAIDAPEPLATSPIYDVLDWLTKRGTRGKNSAAACAAGQDQQSCVWSAWARGYPCAADRTCPSTLDILRCAKRDCVAGFDKGARETRGWCRRGNCTGLDARAHTYDLATRSWALPLILKEGRFPSPEAKRRLEALVTRMRSEAPEDRPSLREALRALDDAEPAPATADRAESRQGVHRKQRKRAGGMLALLKSVDPGKKRV